jgi:hypothetical protein
MRILARAQGIKYSGIIAVMLALVVASVLGQHAVLSGLRGAAGAGASVAERLRLEVEPALFIGGLAVSRNRHVIAGAVMGCVAGAAVGGGGAAAAGVVTGGLGWAAIPAAAGIGCLIGAGGGVAVGYPLDDWALAE